MTNTGSNAVTINGIGIGGANAGDFGQTNTCPGSLAAGANCTILVTFTPTAIGTRTATLSVSDSAIGSPHAVSLSGTGTAAIVSLSPTSLSFANQQVGTTSSIQSATLTNTGNAGLSIASITITGVNSSDFSRTTTCGTALAAGSSCTISVQFTPTALGTRTAAVTITDSASGSPHTVGLTGTGAAAAVSVSPTSLSFGNRVVGTTSAAQSVTVTNTGSAVLTIASITITGTNSRRLLADDDLRRHASLQVPAARISVRFTPTALGTRTAAVTISDSAAGSPQTVSLSGTGISAVTVSPSTLTFATRLIGTTSAASSVTLRNNGSTALSIASITIGGTNGSDFAQTTTCGTSLAAASSCTIRVTFTPTAAFGRTATLTINDSDPTSPQVVTLNGTGTAVSLSATSLTFSRQNVGTTSTAKLITVRNAASTGLTVNGISITGTNSGDFLQTNTCGTSVPAGASCTISVTFRPTASGTRRASVSINDVDPTSPQTVTLTGSGR